MKALGSAAEKFHEFLNHRAFLILMTLVVSFCTSSFAFTHGFSYNWQYGVIFAVALGALTFHFSKYFPKWFVSVLIFYSCVGLIAGTIFIGVSAWLSAATNKANVDMTTLDRQIETIEDNRSSWRTQALIQRAANQITAAAESLRQADSATAKLEGLYAEKRSLEDRSYEQGNMAVFGHISRVSGWSQEQANLLVMWLVVSIFTAMELAMGAALHRKK